MHCCLEAHVNPKPYLNSKPRTCTVACVHMWAQTRARWRNLPEAPLGRHDKRVKEVRLEAHHHSLALGVTEANIVFQGFDYTVLDHQPFGISQMSVP